MQFWLFLILVILAVLLIWIGNNKKDITPQLFSVGSICKKNDQCSNNTCGRQTADDNSFQICCPTEKIISYNNINYCGDMPKGTTCLINDMCASGNCKETCS